MPADAETRRNSPKTQAGILRTCSRSLRAAASEMALEALNRIARLYQIEAQGKPLNQKERQQYRQKHSLPQLQSLHHWLQATRLQTVNGGASAKALDYALKRWPSLIRFAETGHLPIDNNPVENTIRLIAPGKKTGCLWVPNGRAVVRP